MRSWQLDERGSIAWMADPSERMQRASVALAVEGGCLVCDPVDSDGLDQLLAKIGPVLGVCRLLDRHGRDSTALAARHGAPLVAARELGSTPAFASIETRVLYRARRWHETALWLPGRRLLVVAEAVGTIPFFLTRPGDRLGMHMLARLRPPRRALAGLDPDTIAVGHGAPVIGQAGPALARALRRPRLEIPRALLTLFSASRQTR
jgi:hypothetical protein